jgi:hypothetical protein
VINCGGVDFFADDVLYQGYGELGWELALRLLVAGSAGTVPLRPEFMGLRPVYSSLGGEGPGDRGFLCADDFLGRLAPPVALSGPVPGGHDPCVASVGDFGERLEQNTVDWAAGTLNVLTLGHAEWFAFNGQTWCTSSLAYTGGNVTGTLLLIPFAEAAAGASPYLGGCLVWGSGGVLSSASSGGSGADQGLSGLVSCGAGAATSGASPIAGSPAWGCGIWGVGTFAVTQDAVSGGAACGAGAFGATLQVPAGGGSTLIMQGLYNDAGSCLVWGTAGAVSDENPATFASGCTTAVLTTPQW